MLSMKCCMVCHGLRNNFAFSDRVDGGFVLLLIIVIVGGGPL